MKQQKKCASRANLVTLLALLLLLPLSLSACNDKKKTQSTPQRGGTLHIGTLDPLVTLPSQARTPDQITFMDLAYRRLTSIDSAGNTSPDIARSWKVSKDEKTWSFSIDENARFSNDSPITANDIKASIEATSAKSSVSPSSSVLEVVSGFIPFHEGRKASISGIIATAPTELTVKLDEPWADLPAALSSASFGIAPSRRSSDLRRPITSGTFRFSSFDDQRAEMEPASGTTVNVDSLSWRSYESSEKLISDTKSNDIDLALGVNSPGMKWIDYGGTLFYGLNNASTVLKSIETRRAIIKAVDRQKLAKILYGDQAQPLSQVSPQGFPGTADNLCGETCVYQPDADPANFKSLKRSTLYIDSDDSQLQVKKDNSIRDQLIEAGLNAKLRTHKVEDYPTFLLTGKQELFQLGRVPEFFSRDAVVWPLFSSGSPDNVTGFHDDKIDLALSQARSSDDTAARNEKFIDIERNSLASASYLPIAQIRRSYVLSERVSGLNLSLMGEIDVSSVWLKQ